VRIPLPFAASAVTSSVGALTKDAASVVSSARSCS